MINYGKKIIIAKLNNQAETLKILGKDNAIALKIKRILR